MPKNVHDWCTERGISLEELAEQSGVDLGKVQAIYLARRTPSPVEREKIANVLGTSREEIAWGHKTPIQHIYGQGPS